MRVGQLATSTVGTTVEPVYSDLEGTTETQITGHPNLRTCPKPITQYVVEFK